MFPQELLHEQQYLQHLLKKSPLATISAQVQYMSTDGWSALAYDEHDETVDVFFLGKNFLEAQCRITATFIS
jgi:hypothetical protein